MFSKYIPLFFVFGLFSFIAGCDQTISPVNKLGDSPIVQSVSVSPENIQFTIADGFKDTTIVISLDAVIENVAPITIPGYVIRNKNSLAILSSGDLNGDSDSYSANLEIETTTTSFEDYLIEVYAYNTSGSGNFYQTPISIQGFSNNRPEITETSSPGTITRPASGEVPAIFTATINDADGNNTIDRVFLRVIDQTQGEVEGSPFDMFDDGDTFDDETANDFTFTWSLPVPANPSSGVIERDFDIEFFAIDKGGLISDTVRTTFLIRGN